MAEYIDYKTGNIYEDNDNNENDNINEIYGSNEGENNDNDNDDDEQIDSKKKGAALKSKIVSKSKKNIKNKPIKKTTPEKIIDNITIYKHLICKKLNVNNLKLEKITKIIGEDSQKDLNCIKLCNTIHMHEGYLKCLEYYYNLVHTTYDVNPDPILIKMLMVSDSFINRNSFREQIHRTDTKHFVDSRYNRTGKSTRYLVRAIASYGSEIVEVIKYKFNGCNYQLLYKLYEEANKKLANENVNLANENNNIANENNNLEVNITSEEKNMNNEQLLLCDDNIKKTVECNNILIDSTLAFDVIHASIN